MSMHSIAFFKGVFHRLERYERHISSVALVVGFVIDNLTLTRIDLWIDHIVIVAYIIVAVSSIIVVHLPKKGALISRVQPFAPLPMQFAFGGLFSSFFVFYSHSAALASSWFFLLFLSALLVGNEFFKKRYERLAFQFGIFYIALFSYFVFIVPVLTKRMGAGIFLLSGAASIALMSVFIFLLAFIAPLRMREERKVLTKIIAAIFVAMNVLYFLNIIPPIPLALKEAGVYYSVTRTQDGNYILKGEPRAWYAFLKRPVLHISQGAPAYFYSAVFAPTELKTRIVHQWEFFDESRGMWIVSSRVQFAIVGGRDGGYRGYSFKTNVAPGLWRVSVETERGQLLGRRQFKLER